MYIPPFTISTNAINLIAEISAQIERYAIRLEQSDGLRLRKANRVRTIHSSLAIEGNMPCLLYTSPSPRDYAASRMPSSA